MKVGLFAKQHGQQKNGNIGPFRLAWFLHTGRGMGMSLSSKMKEGHETLHSQMDPWLFSPADSCLFLLVALRCCLWIEKAGVAQVGHCPQWVTCLNKNP